MNRITIKAITIRHTVMELQGIKTYKWGGKCLNSNTLSEYMITYTLFLIRTTIFKKLQIL